MPGGCSPQGPAQFLEFDALIVAVPAHRAGPLLAPIDAELAAELGQIEYSGTAIVSLGYDVRQVGHPLDGMGAVVPAIENSPILACSFSSQKYPHRAPAGKTLLRVFVGGARRPELAEMPDAELLPLVLEHLRPLLRIEGEPVFCDIAHWPRTMPQYHVGHQQRVARIEARLALLPGLKMAGSAFAGSACRTAFTAGKLRRSRFWVWRKRRRQRRNAVALNRSRVMTAALCRSGCKKFPHHPCNSPRPYAIMTARFPGAEPRSPPRPRESFHANAPGFYRLRNSCHLRPLRLGNRIRAEAIDEEQRRFLHVRPGHPRLDHGPGVHVGEPGRPGVGGHGGKRRKIRQSPRATSTGSERFPPWSSWPSS